MKTMTNLPIAALLLLGLHSAPAPGAVLVFEDHFGNGVAADSDTTAGYWTVEQNLGGVAPVSESGGTLNMTAGPSAGNNEQARLNGPISGTYSFFQQELTITLRGTITENTVNASSFRFALLSDSVNNFAADDYISFFHFGDNTVALGSKVNGANSAAENVNILGKTAAPGFAGFDLTIGPGAGVNEIDIAWTILITGTDLTGAATLTIAESDWAGGTGDSRLHLLVRDTSTSGTQSLTAHIDSLTVESDMVPEPTSFALLAIGLAYAPRLRRVLQRGAA